MVKNIALAAIVGLFAAGAVVAAPEHKGKEEAAPTATEAKDAGADHAAKKEEPKADAAK